MPKPSKGRRHLSAMIREEFYAMLEKCAARTLRPISVELEVAIARHAAFPEKVTRPPLGELPAGQQIEPAPHGRPRKRKEEPGPEA